MYIFEYSVTLHTEIKLRILFSSYSSLMFSRLSPTASLFDIVHAGRGNHFDPTFAPPPLFPPFARRISSLALPSHVHLFREKKKRERENARLFPYIRGKGVLKVQIRVKVG